MTQQFTDHHACRLCDSGNIEEVLDLGVSPLANAYLTSEQLRKVATGEHEEIFTPLRLFLCMNCGSVQLAHSVDTKILFENYLYESSASPAFVKYFDDLAATLHERGMLPPENELIVDVGSNDGIALYSFLNAGCYKVLGVEPSKDIAERSGAPVITGFMDHKASQNILSKHGQAHLVTAFNVFAHTPDLGALLRSITEILHPEGVFLFEVSYLGSVINDLLFDTIYVEHQFYHSLTPLKLFLAKHGLRIFRAEMTPSHGGSLRVFADRHKRDVDNSVELILFQESTDDNWILRPMTFRRFSDRIHTYKARLHSVLNQYSDKKLFAYSCPAKFTTFTYVLGLSDKISWVIDDSPVKQSKVTPGSHIAIYSKDQARLLASPTERVAMVSAWNHFDPIFEKNKNLAAKWIRPLPHLEVKRGV